MGKINVFGWTDGLHCGVWRIIGMALSHIHNLK